MIGFGKPPETEPPKPCTHKCYVCGKYYQHVAGTECPGKCLVCRNKEKH